jgi:hypothetical protein
VTQVAPASGLTPAGHPVRRFVLALATIGGACMVAWWAGLAAPRVTAGRAVLVQDSPSRGGVMVVELRNDAPLGLDVVRVKVDRDPGVHILTARVDGHDLAAGPARLGGSAAGRLAVRVTVDCGTPLPSGTGPSDGLRVTFEPPLGVDRTRGAGSLAGLVAQACPDRREQR